MNCQKRHSLENVAILRSLILIFVESLHSFAFVCSICHRSLQINCILFFWLLFICCAYKRFPHRQITINIPIEFSMLYAFNMVHLYHKSNYLLCSTHVIWPSIKVAMTIIKKNKINISHIVLLITVINNGKRSTYFI